MSQYYFHMINMAKTVSELHKKKKSGSKHYTSNNLSCNFKIFLINLFFQLFYYINYHKIKQKIKNDGRDEAQKGKTGKIWNFKRYLKEITANTMKNTLLVVTIVYNGLHAFNSYV